MRDFAVAALIVPGHSVATDLAILALAVTIGLGIGSIRWRGLKLAIVYCSGTDGG